jgi:hypothetical protein
MEKFLDSNIMGMLDGANWANLPQISPKSAKHAWANEVEQIVQPQECQIVVWSEKVAIT